MDLKDLVNILGIDTVLIEIEAFLDTDQYNELIDTIKENYDVDDIISY